MRLDMHLLGIRSLQKFANVTNVYDNNKIEKERLEAEQRLAREGRQAQVSFFYTTFMRMYFQCSLYRFMKIHKMELWFLIFSCHLYFLR